MTDLEIRYFLEIVNQGVSFTKASQALYVSQPALTKHINTLGKELGVRLIDTTNKSAPKLTREGKIFYQLFTKWQEQFNKTLEKTRSLSATELRIACLTGWDTEVLLPFKETFCNSYPQIHFSYMAYGFKTLQNGLMNDEYDLIVTLPEQFRGMPNISIHEHYHGSCYLLFSSTHPLVKNSIDHLSIVDFKDDILYILSEDENPSIRQSCEAYCKSKGFIPNIQPLSDLNTILLGEAYTV